MSLAGLPFSVSLRGIIDRAADGFMPLQAWLDHKPFVPPLPVPWRQGEPLNAAALAFSAFFEGMLRETSGDADLKTRWDASVKQPLAKCPIREVAAWRANRGLNAVPVFAITMSDAVVVDTETREISRAEFYASYWPLLEAAFRLADRDTAASGVAVDERAFAASLMADNNPYWPTAGQWRSSRFAKQFVKDVLYCYLGLRGLAPSPWAEAVLIELGERRRIGNRYSPGDAREAVATFRNVLDRLRSGDDARPTAEREHFVQPVGSPPVNARDL